MRALLFALFLIPTAATAQDYGQTITEVVDGHMVARYQTLADKGAALEQVAAADCTPSTEPLRNAWGAAFDAWLMVSHLRFGPSEQGDRAFAMAFWPDTRGKTAKALYRLIAAEDPTVFDAADFANESVAARGFYAMEYMLYDPAFAAQGSAEYRCALIQALAKDIARAGAEIVAEWNAGYADLLRNPGANDTYRTEKEALQEIYKALNTGLQVAADSRLGRPLGSFEKPRPKRAEARRSGRSLHNLVVSVRATEDLAMRLSVQHPDIAQEYRIAYDHFYDQAAALDDPSFAGVIDPIGRLKVEILQIAVNSIRDINAQSLGPALGVAAGFNALDGD